MKVQQSILSALVLVGLTLGSGAQVFAATFDDSQMGKKLAVSDPARAYRSRYIFQSPASGETPEIIEVILPSATGSDVYLVDGTTGQVQAYVLRQDVNKNDIGLSVSVDGRRHTQLTDKISTTGVDLTITNQDTTQQFAELEIELDTETAVNGLALTLDPLSKPPQSVTIKGSKSNGGNAEQIVFVNQLRYTPVLRFPVQEVDKITVTLAYNQTLRLTEVDLVQPGDSGVTRQYVLRFLAKSKENYILFVNPDTQQSITKPSLVAGNLFSRTDVQKITLPKLETNPKYTPADGDGDGLQDSVDNCPTVSNPDQADLNRNSVGDACEDFDADGIINAKDSCPENANSTQVDVDGDGIGDVCDRVESRFTEQNPWLPWVAMGVTGILIAGLFYSVLRSKQFETNRIKTQKPTE